MHSTRMIIGFIVVVCNSDAKGDSIHWMHHDRYLQTGSAWYHLLCLYLFPELTLLHRWYLCSWEFVSTSIVQNLKLCDCRSHWFVVWSLSLEMSPLPLNPLPLSCFLTQRVKMHYAIWDAIQFILVAAICKISDRPHTCSIVPSALWYNEF